MSLKRLAVLTAILFVLLAPLSAAFWIAEECKKEEVPIGYPTQYKRILSKYGYRIHPISGLREFHAGLDMPMPEGTPVYSTIDGEVTVCSDSSNLYGFTIVIENRWFKVKYCHLSEPVVLRGTKVTQGTLVAYSGNSGKATTGPHLHYEIEKYKKFRKSENEEWHYWWERIDPYPMVLQLDLN